MTTADLLCAARAVKPAAAALSTAEKNRLLEAMAQALLDHADNILAANAADVEAARGVIAPVMIDRLSLSPARVESWPRAARRAPHCRDPVGELLSETAPAQRLVIRKVRVPMGVIAIIYESRPNVTADAAALCLKSGNVCVLRGGKEAIRSNTAVVAALRAGLEHCGAPGTLVNLVEDTSRASAAHLMEACGFVDLLIPRGGKGLIRACVDSAKVPCIETGTGICHIYVDAAADLQKALDIVYNAKTSRPSVCNAAEVCLVHRDVAEAFLPALAARLAGKQVELRALPPRRGRHSRHARRAGGFRHRISGLHPGRKGRGQRAGRGGAHRGPLHGPQRGHRHRRRRRGGTHSAQPWIRPPYM